MAEAVFGLCGKFGECLGKSLGHKERIVAKSSPAFFASDDRAFDRSAEVRQNLATPRQRDDAAKPRGALIGGNARKFFQKQGAV